MGLFSNIAHQTRGSEEKPAGYRPLENTDVEMEGANTTDDTHGASPGLSTLPRWLQHSGSRAASPLRRAIHLFSAVLPFPLRHSTTRTLPKVQSTSYMNGLRGIACVAVYINHIGYKYYAWIIHPYDGAGNSHFLQLPGIRILHSGHSMVAIFFVLSGFVLSYSPLRKIHARQFEDLLTATCSSIIRRGTRLFGPVYVLSLLTSLVTWFYPFFEPGGWHNGGPTFLQHATGLIRTTLPIMNPFLFDIYFPRGYEHCWTMGAEYRGSMVVFLACVTTSRLSTLARKAFLVSGALWCMHFDRWDMTCFLSGVFLAELRFAPLAEDFSWASKIKAPPRFVMLGFAGVLAVVDVIALSWTQHGSLGTQPYKMLATWAPAWFNASEMNWAAFSAILTLVLLEHSKWCQWLLTRNVFLYLGEISFSFYLLHLLIYKWIGEIVFVTASQRMGFGYNFSFVVDFIVSFIVLLWSADLYWRAVDEKFVNLSRKTVEWLGVTKPISS